MKKLSKNIIVGLTLSAIPYFAAAQIKNPLDPEYSTLPLFLTALIEGVIIPIGTIVVVVMVIRAGFLFVTAGGNVEKLKSAKTALLWTLIGALIVLGAQAISLGIQGTVEELSINITRTLI